MQKSYEYYNVIGPYVFKAVFDQSNVKALDAFIASHSRLPLEKSEKENLRKIVEKDGVYTLQIEYSPKNAAAMRTSVSKYFEF